MGTIEDHDRHVWAFYLLADKADVLAWLDLTPEQWDKAITDILRVMYGKGRPQRLLTMDLTR